MTGVTQLRNGAVMPLIGLGTSRTTSDATIRAVEAAIDAGYRQFDTAWLYKNETEIGIAIRNKINQGIVKREELFVATKLHIQFMDPSLVRRGCQESLKNLGLDYVDMFLSHGPFKVKMDENCSLPEKNGNIELEPVDIVACWKEMEKLHLDGLAKGIGLSNFNSKQIQLIVDNCTVRPMNLQVECHIYLPQFELHEFCKNLGITFTAFAPLGSPNRHYSFVNLNTEIPLKPMEDPDVLRISKLHHKSAAQVLFRWLVQRGINVIPKSESPTRIQSNIQIFDFNLSENEMQCLNGLGRQARFFDFSGKGMKDYYEYPWHESF